MFLVILALGNQLCALIVQLTIIHQVLVQLVTNVLLELLVLKEIILALLAMPHVMDAME